MAIWRLNFLQGVLLVKLYHFLKFAGIKLHKRIETTQIVIKLFCEIKIDIQVCDCVCEMI